MSIIGPHMSLPGCPPRAWTAALLAACVILGLSGVSRAATSDPSPLASTRAAVGPRFPGTACPAFPADNVWNTPVTGLPIARQSGTWLAHMSAQLTALHPDYGPGGGRSPYGIPWQVTPRHPVFTRMRFLYGDESDRGPYPFSASTPIEGGLHGTGDRHALMVDPATCVLYELYDARYRPGNASSAGSGAIWNLHSDALRPAGWTSADAAGLAILPGLVNYDEVMSGHMDHAIRFTAQSTDNAYVWPARHAAGSAVNPGLPPLGARFRLRPSFRLPASRCARACQVVITTMKTYGMILADNGSNWYFQGTADRRWTDTMDGQLKQIPAGAFQAVDERCLQVSAGSGQARQPGSSAYRTSCARGQALSEG